MARLGKLCFHSGQRRWYCRVDGKQKYLGDTETTLEEAQRRYNDLESEVRVKNNSSRENEAEGNLSDVINIYMKEVLDHNTKRSFSDRKRFLMDYLTEFGSMKPTEVKPYMVQKWVQEHTTWQQATVLTVYRHLSAAYNWLVGQDIITRNPIKGIHKPATVARGEEYVITEAEHQRILKLCKQPYTDIITLLWETGARPSEILSATGREYRPQEHSIVKQHHKTVAKGKRRSILLTDRAEEIVKRRAAFVGDGLLFRSKMNKPICNQLLYYYMMKIFKRAKITHPCIPYSYRTSFAVRHLERGIPIHTVASWLGNTVAVCERHYGHTLERVRNTRHLLQERKV